MAVTGHLDMHINDNGRAISSAASAARTKPVIQLSGRQSATRCAFGYGAMTVL